MPAHPGIKKATTKTGETRYRLRFETTHNGERRVIARTTRTLREARAIQDELRTASRNGTLFAEPEPAAVTVGDLLDAYLAEVRPTVRPVTYGGYTTHAEHVRKALGDRDAASLTRDDVVAARNAWHDRGMSGMLIGRNLRVLRAAYQRAVDGDQLPRNPALNVKPPAYEPGVRRAWSRADAERFVQHAATDRLAACWLLSMQGLRRSEVLGLQWGDIQWDAGELRVQRGRVLTSWGEVTVGPPKSKASRRVVPLGGPVLRALEAMSAVREGEAAVLGAKVRGTDWLAVDAAGNPVHPDAYSKRFKVLCGEAGVPVLRLHEARTTAGTLLREAGVATDAAAKFLGHDPVVYERVYVKTSPERVRSAADALLFGE